MRFSTAFSASARILSLALIAAIGAWPACAQPPADTAPAGGAAQAPADTAKMSRLQKLVWEAQHKESVAAPAPAPTPPLPPNVVRITDSPGGETQPAWSPDGKTLYYVYIEGKSVCIRQHDLETGKAEAISSPHSLPQQLDVSPDGEYLVYSGMMELGVQLYVMRLSDRQTAKLTPNQTNDRETYPRYSRDGMRIFYGTSRPGSMVGPPRVVNRNGENARVCFEEDGLHTRPAVNWKGDKVAWSWRRGKESRIRIMDANVTTLYEDYETPGYTAASIDWYPDDRSLLLCVVPEADPLKGFDLMRYDLETRTMTPVLDLGDTELDVRFAPDGKRIALVSRREGQDEIFVCTLP